ncbi:hypothetical protein SDC9_103198 [bioreactor metagenome]|uniref:Uncharacterized protein n=1 Tax=bioreactor metagenome TaxID=1076179 RepID=A0A645AU33_9ZZZZ
MRGGRGVGLQLHALAGEQFLEWQILCAVHPVLQFLRPVPARELVQHLQHVVVRHGAALGALPQCAHHVVERGAAMLAQRQVQAQRHQRALGVVAHRGVGCVLVLAVILHPGVEAGLGHRLHLASRRLLHLVDGLGEQAQIGGVVDQARAAQQQVVVVAGEALEEPQQLGVVLLVVVVAREFGGAHALDVPGVKVFVADQAEQRVVALGCQLLANARQVAAAADQGRAGLVLQATIAVVHHVEHEQIVRMHGLTLAMPETDFRLTDALGVGQQTFPIERCSSARDDEAVRHAAGGEACAPELAHLHGAIHQLIVVGGDVGAKARAVHMHGRECRCGLPALDACRWRNVDAVRLSLQADGAQAHAGTVEKTARCIQPRRAHRVVVGRHLIRQRQRLVLHALRDPAVFVELLERHRLAALLRGELLQILGELAHQIAAGDPHGQRQFLLLSRPRDHHRHVEEMVVRIGGLHAVEDGGCGGVGGGVGHRMKWGWTDATICGQ